MKVTHNTVFAHVLLFDIHDLYSSPNIVLVIKSRRMRWAGHVARMGEGECVQGFGGETQGKKTTGKTQAWMGG
jgi:hypothetical protein